MKKKFASYLCMGKALTLPLCFNPSESSALGIPLDSLSTLHVIELPSRDVRLLNEYATSTDNNHGGRSGQGTSYAGSVAAEITLPGTDCTTTLSTMNVVVTGLKSGETVFLMYSRNKADTGANTQFDGLRVSTGLTFLSKFVYTINDLSTTNTASSGNGVATIPVDISALGLTAGETIYIQAASAVVDGSNITGTRYSELDEISIKAGRSCASTSTYNDNYTNTGY